MTPQECDFEIPIVCQVFGCQQSFVSGMQPGPATAARPRAGYVSAVALRAYREHMRVAHGAPGAAPSTPESRMSRRLAAAGLAANSEMHRRIVSGNLADREALRQAKRFLRERPLAMAIAGGVGAGKTLSGWWVVAQTDGSRFVVAPDIARVMSDESRHGYISASVLVIDDLGMEHMGPTEYARSQLEELLIKREMAGRPTLLTTNLDPETFRRRYGDRVWSRIYGSGGFAECAGGDARRGGMP